MSDLGTLSHHYKASADLSKELNEAVIELKKQTFHLQDESSSSQELGAAHRNSLIGVLNTLIRELGSSPEMLDDVDLLIPESIVDRVRQVHKGMMVYYVDDLIKLRDKLRSSEKVITDQDIELLDELVTMAGLDSTEVFRRMWRR